MIFNKNIIVVGLLFIFLPSPCSSGESPPSFKEEFYQNGKPKLHWIRDEATGALSFQKYYRDGKVKETGTYREGVLDGPYQEFYGNGQLALEMTFVQGQESGPYKKFFADGSPKEFGQYAHGKLEGELKTYYESGQFHQRVYFKKGLLEGVAKTYFPSGNLKEEANYSDGELDGFFRSFHEEGNLQFTVNYQMGQRQGDFTTYDKNGRLESQGAFSQDLLEGLVVSFYNTGILRSEVYYKSGQPDGIAREYSDRGVLKYLDVYAGGRQISREQFGEDGRKIFPENFSMRGWRTMAIIPDIWQTRIGLAFIFIGMSVLLFRRKFFRSETKRMERPVLIKSDDPGEMRLLEKEFNLLRPESEKLYRRLIETVDNGIFFSDMTGRILYGNFALAKIMGRKSKAEVIGLNLKDELIEMGDMGRGFWEKLTLEHSVKNHRLKRAQADGTVSIFLVSGNPLCNDKGEPVGIEGVVNDMTDRHHLEEALMTEKRKMEGILEFHEKIDNIRDFDELVRFAVDGVAVILESERCSLMLQTEGSDHLRIVGAHGLPVEVIKSAKVAFGQAIAGVVAQEGKPTLVKNIEYDQKFYRAKMPYYLGRSFICVPFRLANQLVGVLNVADKLPTVNKVDSFDEIDLKILNILTAKIVSDIDNIHLLNQLNLLTVTDPMTQIFNYRRFSEALEREIGRVKREPRPLAIAMIDIDHFKTYNDSFGHLSGDELLRTLGEVLKKALRETDIICRYAGDEFCVVFPETAAEGATNAVEKIRQMMKTCPFKREVTLSIGIAQYQKDMTMKDFIQKADKALYEAKQSGRNRVVTA